MRNFMVILAFLSLSLVAGARTTVCGRLVQQEVFPVCVAGQMCPHYIRLQYAVIDISNGVSERTLLNVSASEVHATDLMASMSQLVNSNVCVTGTQINNQLSVDEIVPMPADEPANN